MKAKMLLNLLLTGALVFILGCGMKIGSLDVGKIATTGSRVLMGNKLSLEEQQDIGRQMAAIIVGSSQVHSNRELQEYVNKVGRWLAMHSSVEEDDKSSWQFIVIDTPDFNAFSMPGGYVIISSGVIDRISSEAELAAVLAHEIVHIEQKHQVRAIEKSSRFSDMGALAFIAADFHQLNKGDYSSKSLANRQIAKGLLDVTHNLYTKGLGRDDELDADQKAVTLMTRAGYDPYAYLSVLQIVDSIDDNNKMLILATHPKVNERMQVAYNALNYVEKYLHKTKVVEQRFMEIFAQNR